MGCHIWNPNLGNHHLPLCWSNFGMMIPSMFLRERERVLKPHHTSWGWFCHLQPRDNRVYKYSTINIIYIYIYLWYNDIFNPYNWWGYNCLWDMMGICFEIFCAINRQIFNLAPSHEDNFSQGKDAVAVSRQPQWVSRRLWRGKSWPDVSCWTVW